ncbi:MAG TPA: hypothetical protein VLD64_01885 [Nitrosarchaeum sp.]|nr:hypothetical protein [Nitrosarchaeum sp.]
MTISNSKKTKSSFVLPVSSMIITALAISYILGMTAVKNADGITCTGSNPPTCVNLVFNKRTTCAWSTSSTTFTTISCGASLSTAYQCPSGLTTTCGALAVATFEQYTGFGDFFFTELRVDGVQKSRGYDQCIVPAGATGCELQDRMAALSIAEPITGLDTDTFTVVGRVGSTTDTATVNTGANLDLIV